uniref:Uncharacterized protein n=1 Tax=Nicotiana tabacum TaxID=4097 RepID=A0A1S4C3L9_TOBAC|nr:PREDICTED: uncharacterized protein LOC107814711 [Nicotiana tabacum]
MDLQIIVRGENVRNPLPYSIHISQFEWVVHRFTIVESIPKNNEKEALLPPSSRLSTISLLNVEQQPCGVEFDLLAVVANCGAMQYPADQTNRFQEAIVMDNSANYEANKNKQMLIEYTMKSSTELASSVNLVAVDDEILSVSAIAMQTSTAETFYIEGEISLPDHFQ